MFSSKKHLFNKLIPEVVAQYGDNKALGFVGETAITYSQMEEQIHAVIAYLEELGICPNDKVIIFSQNMPNWCITYLALQYMGAVAVPVLPDFTTHELDNVIQHSGAKAIFISNSLLYKIEKIARPEIFSIVDIESFKLLSADSPIFREQGRPQSTYSPDEDALAVLLYTSGTTGNSKGVMLSQRNLLTNVAQSNIIYPIPSGHRLLSVLPLSHTYENTIGFLLPILKGAYINYLHKPPTASVLTAAMKSLKPDMMLTVPMIIERIYSRSILPELNKKFITRQLYKFRPTQILLSRLAGKKLMATFGGNIKFFGIGGSKLDADTERFLLDAKFPVSIGYGLTETSPLLSGAAPGKSKFQSAGYPVSDCELIIHQPNPETGEGEIWARGKNIMLGYYKNEEITKEVLTDDGWFKTGDLGVLDKDGILTHKGRIKSLIVGSNGENIYPEEIESLINHSEFVLESVVVERNKRLVALVHFDTEDIAKKLKDASQSVEDYISELIPNIRESVNSKVNKISKIQDVETQDEPFLKTATKKIKRYLYR